MSGIAERGFTLAELLAVTVILGALAAAAIPLLSGNDAQKLTVAAEETANLLRFAVSEAQRTSGYVLVDGATTPGHLMLFHSDANANTPPTAGTSAILDPLNKRAVDLNVSASAFSQGVTLTPQFNSVGPPDLQILIGPGLSQIQTVKNDKTKAPLAASSGVVLSYRGQSVTVGINELTGLVSLP